MKEQGKLLLPLDAPFKVIVPLKQKPVLWEQALIAACFWGTSNFFYSVVGNHDVAVTALSWPGFIAPALVYRIYQIAKIKRVQNSAHAVETRHFNLKETIIKTCFTKICQLENMLHHSFRMAVGLIYIWLIILAGEYCRLAGVNPGIVYACFSVSIIFNCLFSYILFGERLSLKMCFGIGIVIVGVVWVSLAQAEGG
jgi:drug/metabolite transporter (DMT)-like permease